MGHAPRSVRREEDEGDKSRGAAVEMIFCEERYKGVKALVGVNPKQKYC